MVVTSPNLLLIGPEVATARYLAQLVAFLDAPVVWCEGASLRLPDGAAATLVIHDVDQLSRRGQAGLLAWLDEPGRGARLVTTAQRSLYSRVRTGRFSDALYYRINTIVLALKRTAVAAGGRADRPLTAEDLGRAVALR